MICQAFKMIYQAKKNIYQAFKMTSFFQSFLSTPFHYAWSSSPWRWPMFFSVLDAFFPIPSAFLAPLFITPWHLHRRMGLPPRPIPMPFAMSERWSLFIPCETARSAQMHLPDWDVRGRSVPAFNWLVICRGKEIDK
jgi:hypothetical protein